MKFARGLTHFEYQHLFWRFHERMPFSTAEIALYFRLLQEANLNRWQMPFNCYTDRLTYYVRVSKQGLINARKKLEERGLIAVNNGVGKNTPASYTLLSPTESEQAQPTSNAAQDLTQQLPQDLTQNLTLQKNKAINNRYNYGINRTIFQPGDDETTRISKYHEDF